MIPSIDIWIIFIYLFSLILVGVYANKQSKNNSLLDLYLGNREYGTFFLFLTFYATQYSGNTVIGFTGKAYRDGWITIFFVTSLLVVVAGLLSYAPKLYKRSKEKNYITINDYIEDRYPNKILHYFLIVIILFTLGSYILSNLKAVGYIVQTLSDDTINYTLGIIIITTIIFIYEALGSMRSVVLTDAIQGILLLITIQIIFFVILSEYGINTNFDSYSASKIAQTPDNAQQITWISTIILLFFGASIYPQAIQRIFMAKKVSDLKKTFKLISIMPFFTVLPVIIIAVIAIDIFPNLPKEQSDLIMPLMLKKLSHIPMLHWVAILFFAATLSAIMSTIDSSNIAIHSMLVKNVFLKYYPNSTESTVKLFSIGISFLLLSSLAYLAIMIDGSIWSIIRLKLEILAQLFPMIVLGVWNKTINSLSVLTGLIFGLIITLSLVLLFDIPKILYIHAGLWGVMVNITVLFLLHFFQKTHLVKRFLRLKV